MPRRERAIEIRTVNSEKKESNGLSPCQKDQAVACDDVGVNNLSTQGKSQGMRREAIPELAEQERGDMNQLEYGEDEFFQEEKKEESASARKRDQK